MIDSPFRDLLTKQYIFGGVLVVLIMILSVGLVYIRNASRVLHSELQNVYEKRDKLQDAWSQLLLEHGTWASDVRVEQVASENLGMVQPKKIKVIKP